MCAQRDRTPRTPECPGLFASLRSEQGAGLACRLGRCFKAFHALRSPPETRTPLRCESRYSHNVNGVTTMCGHAVYLFYCLTNTSRIRRIFFCLFGSLNVGSPWVKFSRTIIKVFARLLGRRLGQGQVALVALRRVRNLISAFSF